MYITETERILMSLKQNSPMTWAKIVGEEIQEFINSDKYIMAEQAEKYYRNRSAVQDKTNRFRLRSNTKNEQPILRKLIEQKMNYMLTRPFSANSDDKLYSQTLAELFDNNFRSKLKRFGRAMPKQGIAYMQPYIDSTGAMRFKIHNFKNIIPLWEDEEKESLGGFIYFATQIVYIADHKTTVIRAELWDRQGVRYFVQVEGGQWQIDPERPDTQPHFLHNGKATLWSEVPLLWARYNEEEFPLYYYLKELIDTLNWNLSVTDDVLRDVANFIFLVKGYGGTDINELVKDLQEALAVLLDADGNVDKMQAELNIDAVMGFMDDVRRKIYDYGNGVDTKDPDLGNASGRAIGFRYSDLDNDCQSIALELQQMFERAKLFIDAYFALSGKGDFTNKSFEIVFNMDMPINETEVVTNLTALAGGRTITSQKTLIKQNPYVEDVEEEFAQIEAEEKEALENSAEFGFPAHEGGDNE